MDTIMGNWKFYLVTLSLLCVSNYAYSYFRLKQSVYYNDYWGNWKEMDDTRIQGNYDGFIIYEDHMHPSDYFFSFQIQGYVTPSKKDIKQHYKTNTWWVYDGYVEYYICDLYPTVVDVFKAKGRLLKDWDINKEYENSLSALKASKMMKGQSYTPIGFKKVRKNATIKIAPYKKVPQVYNIYFDGGGYAIDLNNTKFENGRPIQIIKW